MEFEFVKPSKALSLLRFKEFCLKKPQLLRSRTFWAILLENTGVSIKKNAYCGIWVKIINRVYVFKRKKKHRMDIRYCPFLITNCLFPIPLPSLLA